MTVTLITTPIKMTHVTKLPPARTIAQMITLTVTATPLTPAQIPQAPHRAITINKTGRKLHILTPAVFRRGFLPVYFIEG
jgi:hypothetical protein